MIKKMIIPSFVTSLIFLVLIFRYPESISPQQKMAIKEYQFEVGATFGDRDVFEFIVEQEGTITVEASWTGEAPHLALILNGPTRQEFSRNDGKSPLKVSHNVTQTILNKGTNWKVSIVNFSRRGSAGGTVKVTYPEEKKITPSLKFKPKMPLPTVKVSTQTQCEVQGIKPIYTSPNKVRFQVQYYIPPSYPKACFIAATVPKEGHLYSQYFSYYMPTGFTSDGIPKGQVHFRDNIQVEVGYEANNPPPSYTSSTIQIFIYNQDGKELCSKILNWEHNWRTAQCSVQSINWIYTSPSKVRFQVQYQIPPSYPKACFIGAYVPRKNDPYSRYFSYDPAGRLPDGVPKGQVRFRDNVVVEVNYGINNPPSSYNSSTIQVVIYDQDQNELCSEIINWGQTWKIAQCDVQGISPIFTSPSKVRFQVQYQIPPSYPKACFIGATVPRKDSQDRKYFSSMDAGGSWPDGVPKGQVHFRDNVVAGVNYGINNPPPSYTSSTIEVFIYDQDQNELCSEIINWGQTWKIAELRTEVSAGSSDDLDRHRRLYEYSLPPGKTPDDIVAIGEEGMHNLTFTWYRDGTVSVGSSDDLDKYRKPYRYSLPSGKRIDDIVGIGVDGDYPILEMNPSEYSTYMQQMQQQQMVSTFKELMLIDNINQGLIKVEIFVWYRDGTVSVGTPKYLDFYKKPYRYTLPTGKIPLDIVGMAIDGESNYCFAWYRDGTVSAGSSEDLNKHRKPYRYSLPPGKTPDDIVGIGVDGENNYNFVWFKH